jgi:hypothetical protein
MVHSREVRDDAMEMTVVTVHYARLCQVRLLGHEVRLGEVPGARSCRLPVAGQEGKAETKSEEGKRQK